MLNRIPFVQNLTFQKTLLVYSILLGIVPVLLIGLLSSNMAAKSIQEEVNLSQQIILRQIENQVDAMLKDLQATSLQMANDLTIEKALRYGISMQNLESTLGTISAIGKYRNYSKIGFHVSLVNPSYEQVYSNQFGLQPIKDFRFYELIRTLDMKQQRPMLIPPHTYPNQPELMLLRTIYLNALPSDAIVIMHIDAKQLNDLFTSVNLGGSRKALVVDDQGQIVLSADRNEVGSRLSPSSELFSLWSQTGEANSTLTLDRVQYQASSQKSGFNGWTYIALTPVKELSKKADHIKLITWYMVAGLAALWLVISVLGSRRLTVPLQRITQKVTKEINGSGNEFAALNQYIDRMVEMNKDMKNKLFEQLPQLKDSVLLQLLRGELTEEEINGKLKQVGVRLQGQWFYVCVVEIDQYGQVIQTYGERDRALLMYALSKLITEICEETFSCAIVSAQPGQVTLIVGADDDEEFSGRKLLERCELINELVKKYFKFTATVAVSQAYKRYGSICEGYQEALMLLHNRTLIDKHRTITYKEMTNDALSQQSSRLFVKWQKAIVEHLGKGDFEQAAMQINDMIDTIPEHVHNHSSAMGIFNFLLGGIDHLLQEMGYELSDCLEGNIYRTLYDFRSLEEIREWLVETVLPSIRKHLTETDEYDGKKMIRQLIGYIHEHIEEDLSLQQVADAFQLTTAKVRALFKEELNTNFINYLIDYRIAKAKEWLIHSEMSVKEISDRLSYTSPQNFSRIFKQMTGVSPGKFRDEFYRKE